ncbi:MAG: heavy metal translocating P-type ATPase [Byssovorax sp.]
MSPPVDAVDTRSPCRHCGLGSASTGGYCCYGCELAAQIAGEGEQRRSELYGLITFCLLLSMIVMMLSLFLFAEDVYEPGGSADLGWMRSAYRGASALLSTPVVYLLGKPLLRRALRALRARRLTMDLLVVAGAAAAYALSISNVVRGRPGVYFDSATSALVLTTLGRYLEASARARASRVIAPSLQLVGGGVLAEGEDGVLRSVSPSTLIAGARLQIQVEETVPVDVRVAADGGEVEVTLAVLTGAAAPVTMQPGDEIPAGAVVVAGPLRCTALRSARESTLERLADLAKSLKERPSRLQRLGDAFAGALVPLVAALALFTFALTAARGTLDHAVVTALAVVLAACPCTYGVATPLVLWLALRKALAHGVCVRNASALEELSAVRSVAFDKTGTLTDPRLAVLAAELTSEAGTGEIASLVAALEVGSRHPVARALAAWADRGHPEPAALTDRRVVVGRGVIGRDAAGRALSLGAPRWLDEAGTAPRGSAAAARVALARDGVVLARFSIGEALRPEAREAISALRALGIQASILTGDTAEGTVAVAAALGIEALSALSPLDKVTRLAARGKTTAMVGDGINDAPALAAAGPSFAMDGGAGLARGMAQVTLLRPDLRLVPWTIALARRATEIGYQNLVASTAYNLIFLGLAATGLLRPVWAGLSMLTSSLLTLASSLRVSSIPGLHGEGKAPLDEALSARPAAPLEAR